MAAGSEKATASWVNQLRVCHCEAAQRDFSGQPERHEAPGVSMFLSPPKAILSFMNMHIWNLSRRNPWPLAGVLIESSCQLKMRRVAQWRVLFSGAWWVRTAEGWPHLALQPAGMMWNTRSRREQQVLFFFFRTGRTRSLAGGPAGAKVEAAYFIHLS